MAFAPPLIDSGHAADAFAEALNGMAVGIVSLAFARRALASACADKSGASENLRELILQARQAGRLSDDTCATLLADLDQGHSEDEPTEWSREAARSSAQPRAPSSSAATLSPGVILRDRFVLEQRLDTNGMCEVYRALDRRRREAGADSASVTIKLVSPATPRHEDALRLLQHEAALAPRLEHPNIARVFDFDRDGKIAFITREWLDGRSLAELMDRQRHRPLDPKTCARILVAIADALRFAHSRGVVHADVKPGNIVLTGDGTAKLIDFGIARVDSGRVDEATTGAGTPAYSSCEALEGQAATPQDDLFALACIAYRMYAGHRAFGNEDALTAERDGHPPARIVKLDDPQWQALERALAFRREERTRDIDTFLREFLGTAAGSAEAPRARDFPAPAIPRAPWVVAGGAMAVLVLAVALWPAADAPPNAETAASARLPPVTPVLPPLPVPVPTSTAAFQEEPAAQGAAAPAVTTVSSAEPPRRKLLPDAAPPQAAATTGAAPAAPGKVAVRPASPSAPLPGEAAAAGAPGPAEVVRVDEGPLAPAPDTADEAPGPALALARAPSAAPPDVPQASAISQPQQVALGELTFRRYVEPKDRRRTLGRDPEGWVELSFIVDARGETRDIAVTASSPAGRYEETAVSAVRRWRFEPVIEDSQAVERRTEVRLRFQPER